MMVFRGATTKTEQAQAIRTGFWQRGFSLLLSVAIVTAPILIVLGILALRQLDFSHYVPDAQGELNDMFFYWRQGYTFSEVGFHGGYYTIHEYEAPASFSHFYYYGPLVAMIYGSWGWLFGWHLASGPVAHAALYMLAASLFLLMTRASIPQRMALFLLVVTFWPLLLFLPITMQEALHHVLAIAYAGGFYLLLMRREQTAQSIKLSLSALIVAGALLRITWAALFIPLFMLSQASNRPVWVALFKGIATAIVFVILFMYLSAPYPNALSEIKDALLLHPESGVARLVEQAERNLTGLGTLSALHAQVVRVYLLVLIAAIAGLIPFRTPFRAARLVERILPLQTAEAFFHVFNLGVILLATLTLYTTESWIGYRVLAPPLLLSLVLLVLYRRYGLALLQVALSLMILMSFRIETDAIWSGMFNGRPDEAAQRGQELAKVLHYDPLAANAWCNTLYLDLRLKDETLLAPAGIGISFFKNIDQTKGPIRSQYLLIDDATYDQLAIREQLEPLLEMEGGTVYRNLNADCAPVSTSQAAD